MIKLEFQEIHKQEAELFAEWISSDSWPTFQGDGSTKQDVLMKISEGEYFNDDTRNFWVVDQSKNKIGVIEIYDLSDLAPMFSIRIKTAYRKKGIGTQCMEWLCSYFFETFPDKERLEAQTREDNVTMRKLFNNFYFQKEAYYRKAWPLKDGTRLASVGYGLLKEDWKRKKKTPVSWEKDDYFSDN